MRFIDLSVTIETTSSEPVPVEIDYVDHTQGADILGSGFGVDHRHFPDQMGVSLEHIRLTSHTGTHVDAPLHYGPLCEGKPSRAIDGLPLDWFFRPGVKLDCHGDVEQAVSLEELRTALEQSGHTLKPFDIVLIATGADQLWGRPEYFTHFRGISQEATAWLVEQGVKVIGIDSYGFDPPFARMLNEYRRSGNSRVLWPAHVYGRKREYCQIERLANLQALSGATDFQVCCFPIKIKGCGAAWSRVVALVEDNP